MIRPTEQPERPNLRRHPSPADPGDVSAETPGEHVATRTPADPLAELDAVGEEIAELAAHVNAATYRLLERIAAFDALFEECGGGTGFRSTAHWLAWRTGLTPGAAREKVRVAKALRELPALGAAMERGALSYSKLRALTRVATADNETALLELAAEASAAQLERLVRGWRRQEALEEADLEEGGAAESERERHQRRRLTLRPSEDGSWEIRGRLDPEVGAMLEKALEAAGEALYGRTARGDHPAGPEPPTAPQRWADALGLLAEAVLDAGDVSAETSSAPVSSRADRYQVVLHLERPMWERAEKRVTETLSATLGHRLRVSAETSRRIACDAGLVPMLHDERGGTLGVGRRSRTVPAPVRRALEHRDRRCRFPGCANRHCDAHHVVHWSQGGETKLSNLVLLCRRHHRTVHEGGFRVEVEVPHAGEARFRFYRPDGRRLPGVPPMPPVPREPLVALRARVRGAVSPDAATGFDLGFDLGFALDALRTDPVGSRRVAGRALSVPE